MDTLPALSIVLVVAAIVVCGLAAYALVTLAGTMRSVRKLSDDLDERLVPLLDKLDVTVDAANAELLRIDNIVTVFEDASAKVSATTAAVHDAVSAPKELVENVGVRLRAAWKHSREQHGTRAVANTAEAIDDGADEDAAPTASMQMTGQEPHDSLIAVVLDPDESEAS